MSTAAPNQLLLFLHAHLPFIRHPEHEDSLEEDWLFEAITEVYLPLIRVARGWVQDRLPIRLAVSLSPTLISMLEDELLMRRYRLRLSRLVDIIEGHAKTLPVDHPTRAAVLFQSQHLQDLVTLFEDVLDRDVLGAFDSLEQAGVLELATCVVTHAFLPLYALKAHQAAPHIRVAVRKHRQTFGRNPPGIWLPECGYVPGLDQELADAGLCYFFVDSHALAFADPPPLFGTHAPIVCPSGVLAFARDPEASQSVWSAEQGYPGDSNYREFHRDIGFDVDEQTLQGLMLPGGQRRHLGLKCHRVTGLQVDLADKLPYERQAALRTVHGHAQHFVQDRAAQAQAASRRLERTATICAPFDAELFGHWWFEGPEFLDQVARTVAARQDLAMVSPSQVITQSGPFQVSTPSASSWGHRGYSEVWLNDKNDWIWPHLHQMTRRFEAIIKAHTEPDALTQRALQQLARELLLASASDWPFMITMDTTVSYAQARVRSHVERFRRLAEQIEAGRIDQAQLSTVEMKDNLLPGLELQDFR